MESVSGGLAVNPPWEVSEFFTEAGLRAAQEYFFQTHATNTRLIAEGRNAQGIGKTLVRRKLTRELGDDFKMYTGSAIGEGGDADVSKGIRGELNELLGHIYARISPNQPITSPIQEDLTILSHPHGGVEVCYAMAFYYQDLMRKYASLASNRRMVLRSIMDEEMFKWIWRMAIAYMLAPKQAKMALENFHLSAGLRIIPPDKQRVSFGQKIHEIGMFLLSKNMHESKLRAPLCLYFVTYLRQLQSQFVIVANRREVEQIFQRITKHIEGEEIGHPLMAVDLLMNGKGNSMESFDDVLRDEHQISQLLPANEAEFINQFEDFGNPKRLAATLRKLVPDPRKEIDGGEETSMMPLLLMLRTMPNSIRDVVLAKMPVPLLNMVRNRVLNTSVDDIGKELVDRIRQFLDARRAKGETYGISGHSGVKKGAVSTSLPTPKAKPSSNPGTVDLGGGAVVAEGKGAGGRSAPASPEKAPAERPTESAASRKPPSVAEEKALIAWEVVDGRILAVSISATDLVELAGKELRLLLPFVVLSLRTGQIFGLEPDKIKRETVEKLMRSLHTQIPTPESHLIPREQVLSLLQAGKTLTMSKLLRSVVEAHGVDAYASPPPDFAPVFSGLEAKVGDQLKAFLDAPGDPAFRELRSSLTDDEKFVLGILHRVARAQ